MPDKSKRTSIDGLAGWFSINQSNDQSDIELDELPAQAKPKFNKPEVLFKYENDINKSKYVHDIEVDGILQLRDVTLEVLKIQDVIKNRANQFINILRNGVTSNEYKINKDCKSCEFKCDNNPMNGYKECWGTLADSDPHIFDLYYGGSLTNKEKEVYFNRFVIVTGLTWESNHETTSIPPAIIHFHCDNFCMSDSSF